jgi:hypothetical protein
MVKQFLKSTGVQGIPQGSPLSPLLANLALNDLDHLLDRGSGYITYARYLDDMVVLAPNSAKGKAWADRALARIRCEAEAIGVSLNTEKTRIVTITDERAVFAFLGFEFRWVPSTKTGRWYPCMTPRPKKITAVLRKVKDALQASRHLSVQAAVARVNPILRGWVNYFQVGNSSQAFNKVRYHVERKVRRFAAKQRKDPQTDRRPCPELLPSGRPGAACPHPQPHRKGRINNPDSTCGAPQLSTSLLQEAPPDRLRSLRLPIPFAQASGQADPEAR